MEMNMIVYCIGMPVRTLYEIETSGESLHSDYVDRFNHHYHPLDAKEILNSFPTTEKIAVFTFEQALKEAEAQEKTHQHHDRICCSWSCLHTELLTSSVAIFAIRIHSTSLNEEKVNSIITKENIIEILFARLVYGKNPNQSKQIQIISDNNKPHKISYYQVINLRQSSNNLFNNLLLLTDHYLTSGYKLAKTKEHIEFAHQLQRVIKSLQLLEETKKSDDFMSDAMAVYVVLQEQQKALKNPTGNYATMLEVAMEQFQHQLFYLPIVLSYSKRSHASGLFKPRDPAETEMGILATAPRLKSNIRNELA